VSDLLGERRFRYFHIDRCEVCHSEVLPVELLSEVVDVVDEEASAVDDDRLADSEVCRREILLHLTNTFPLET